MPPGVHKRAIYKKIYVKSQEMKYILGVNIGFHIN